MSEKKLKMHFPLDKNAIDVYNLFYNSVKRINIFFEMYLNTKKINLNEFCETLIIKSDCRRNLVDTHWYPLNLSLKNEPC